MANQEKKAGILTARVNMARVGAVLVGHVARHPKKEVPSGGGDTAYHPTQTDPLPDDATYTIEVLE